MEHREWIDGQSYYNLLRRWRFAPIDEIFIGETGEYYKNKMIEKKGELTPEEAVRISKDIGW